VKLLFIGLSHVAAFRDAAPHLRETYPDVEMDFFGLRWIHLMHFRLGADGRWGLDPARREADPAYGEAVDASCMAANGQVFVTPGDYDAVALVGLEFGTASIRDLLSRHDVEGFPSRRQSRRLSRAMFDDVSRALADQAYASIEPLGLGRPLYAFERPLLAADSVDSAEKRYRQMRRLSRSNKGLEALHSRFLDKVEARFESEGVTLIRQPPETIADGLATRAAYSRGSIKLAGGEQHDSQDFAHMNWRYGACCIQTLLETQLGLRPKKKSLGERLTGLAAALTMGRKAPAGAPDGPEPRQAGEPSPAQHPPTAGGS
jgi:hypothetical protein